MNDVLTIHEYTFEGLESFLLELDLSLILRKDLEHLLETLLFFLGKTVSSAELVLMAGGYSFS